MALEMKAAVLYGKEDIRMEHLPVPEPGNGELVVRVQVALTCGTDLKVYRRGYHAKMLQTPIPFGHEFAGHVAKVGKGTTGFHEGDRVMALNSAPCGSCFFCLHGQENLCNHLLFNNGAYAEYIRIPARIVERNTLLVPQSVLLEHAAMTEPLACVVHGMDETDLRPGGQMVVIGAGPIGLMFIHLAQRMGMDVIAVVKHAAQVQTAKSFGARQVVQTTATEDAVAAVRALTTNHHGADAVVEAVATPLAWQWAVDMVRKGGVVNFFGGCTAGSKVSLDTNRMHYSNLTLRASFHHTPSVSRRAFEWIAGGKFDCAPFLTARASLEEVPQVFHRMMDRSGPEHVLEIKTVVCP